MSQPAPTLPPDQAIAELLLDVAVTPALGLTYGTNLFTGPVRAMTDDTEAPDTNMPTSGVFVLLASGEAPNNAHDSVEKTANVHVWIRGMPRAFDAGQALARQIWRTINRQLVDNYIGVECNESEPRYSGEDGHCHLWMIAVRMIYWE